jgi:acetylornithine deacetylase/succinyl-diaminopimelate desuccinylase-like protein
VTREVSSSVDAERAARYLAELAVPRLSGTEMERETARRIEEHFRSLGLAVTREPFAFGTMGLSTAKLFVALFPASLFACLLLLEPLPLLSFSLSFGVLLLFSYVTRNSAKMAWVGHAWNARFESHNVVGVKEPASGEKLHLIIGAHYDSVNLSRNIYRNHYRMVLVLMPVFYVTVALLAVIALIGLLSSLSGLLLPQTILWMLLGLSGVLTLFFVTYLVTGHGNASPGASDNASGVAVLMELAKALQDHPLEHLRISFIAFGAEEFGLLGSNNYFFAHRGALEASGARVISVDMPGGKGKLGYVEKYGLPPKKTDPRLNEMLAQAAQQVGVECEAIELPPFHGSDHEPFDQRGIPTTFLGAVSKESMKTFHTRHDDLESIDYDNLSAACRLLHRTVLNMDESLKTGAVASS